MIEDNNWREMLKYAVDNNNYSGCAILLPDGAENDSIDQMAQLVAQAAQRTLLGSGNASLCSLDWAGATSGRAWKRRR